MLHRFAMAVVDWWNRPLASASLVDLILIVVIPVVIPVVILLAVAKITSGPAAVKDQKNLRRRETR